MICPDVNAGDNIGGEIGVGEVSSPVRSEEVLAIMARMGRGEGEEVDRKLEQRIR